MQGYWDAIQISMLAFPFAALLFTVPFLAVQYKKYGAVPLLRGAVVYTFILYLMCVYFLAILPLPAKEDVAAMTGPRWVLMPLNSIQEFIAKHGTDLSQFSGWKALLSSSAVRELLLNILMFLPFGIYLRYYFNLNWKKTLLLGFLGSLFLELTQLSGLYFIYPRPYRLFDVDDLFNNTLGTMLGFWITPVLCRFLPTRAQLDASAYRRGRRVPMLRRLFGLCVDWILAGLCTVVLTVVLHSLSLISPNASSGGMLCFTCVLYFVVLQWLLRGRTPGKGFVRVKIVRMKGGAPRLWQLAVREGLLYAVILPAPFYALLGALYTFSGSEASDMPFEMRGVLIAAASMAVMLTFACETVMKLLNSEHLYFYERLSGTKVISTIPIPVPLSAEGGETDVEASAAQPMEPAAATAKSAPPTD